MTDTTHDLDDQRLEAAVEHRLAADFLIDESQIEVEVVDRVATLVGTVGSYAEKLVAQNTARSVEGVHDLVNAIAVKPQATMRPGDDELRRMVEQILTWDALVPEEHLKVAVSDGLVALTGACPTYAQAQEAERAVSHLGGVRGVLNRIDVTKPELSTHDVRRIIHDALTTRAAHQASQLDIIIEGATVTLAGTVHSTAEKRAIVGAVGHGPGVASLHDELQVEGLWERGK